MSDFDRLPEGEESEEEEIGARADSPYTMRELTARQEKPMPVKEMLSAKELQEEQYTHILESFGDYYEKKSERNHFFKAVFFFVILVLLVLVIAGFAVTCILLVLKKNPNPDWTLTVPVAASGTATLLGALIVLPEVIAKHLFPTDEDRVIVDLISVLKGADK